MKLQLNCFLKTSLNELAYHHSFRYTSLNFYINPDDSNTYVLYLLFVAYDIVKSKILRVCFNRSHKFLVAAIFEIIE